MAETYYIRLPFYLINGTTPKTVDISFNNELVSSAEITATDVNNKTNVTFSTSKDPGNYEIEIVPTVITDDFTTVCLDDIWISNDNINFYSVLVNYQDITTNLPSIEFGFDPAKGACLWADCEFVTTLVLPDADNWTKTYKSTDLSSLESGISYLTANPTVNPTLLSKVQEAYSLFKARGYN